MLENIYMKPSKNDAFSNFYMNDTKIINFFFYINSLHLFFKNFKLFLHQFYVPVFGPNFENLSLRVTHDHLVFRHAGEFSEKKKKNHNGITKDHNQ